MHGHFVPGRAKDNTVRQIRLFVGETEYKISESTDGKLVINKVDGKESHLIIYSSASNEIKVE